MRESEQAPVPMMLTIIPIGTCFLQCAIWSALFVRSLNHGYDVKGVLLLAAIIWLALGVVISDMLAFELTKRGAFFRLVVRSDLAAVAGELNLFLGLVAFFVFFDQNRGLSGSCIAHLLMGAFVAIGSMIYGLACIKSGSFTADQLKMAIFMAELNGIIAFGGTLLMAQAFLFVAYA